MEILNLVASFPEIGGQPIDALSKCLIHGINLCGTRRCIFAIIMVGRRCSVRRRCAIIPALRVA
ncbi:MAG: hypothetical protein CME19_01015 [Gemmatimonadetes bacterium]|nr:hypothetical protein [Gemmatimonadota bacterium]